MQAAKSKHPKGRHDVNSEFLATVGRQADCDSAIELLKQSEIQEYAHFVVLAIAITKKHDWLASGQIAGLLGTEEHSKIADALFVILMFNVVNSIASHYALRPEWSSTQWFAKSRKQLLLSMLPRFVKLECIPTDDSLACNLTATIDDLELGEPSPVWQKLSLDPRLAIAGQQLLFAYAMLKTDCFQSQQKLAGQQEFEDVFCKSVELATGRLDSHPVVALLKRAQFLESAE